MTGVLPILLGVMLLTEPDEIVDAAVAAAVSADADRAGIPDGKKNGPKSARITSDISDYDREAGVVMFEGHVVVQYADDYTMCSDRLYMFLSGSNELARVVAVGNVSITNDTRIGSCSLATYRRKKHEIEMFGDGGAVLAHLIERGEDASELTGTRIKFWLDSEQVEVDNSNIKVKEEGKSGLL